MEAELIKAGFEDGLDFIRDDEILTKIQASSEDPYEMVKYFVYAPWCDNLEFNKCYQVVKIIRYVEFINFLVCGLWRKSVQNYRREFSLKLDRGGVDRDVQSHKV